MKVVGYIRISQPDENPENQSYVIEKWAKESGYEVIFLPPETCSGEEDPLKRPIFKMGLDILRNNGLDTIVMTDITRFSRKYDYTIKRLVELTSQGVNLVFINTPIPQLKELRESINSIFENLPKGNPISNLMANAIKDLTMKLLEFISDIFPMIYAMQSEAYLQEVRLRTKLRLSKLKDEGKLYHRPRIIHYVALYLSGKEEFRELTKEDLEKAKQYVRGLFKYYIELKVPMYEIVKIAKEKLKSIYLKYPKTPHSYDSVKRLLEDVGLI